KSTFDVIKEKVIDKLGGELQIRKENGVRFLDVVERVGEDKDTEIRLSKNLVTMTCDVDPVQIITRLTPLGTHMESDNEEDTDASQARLTIESVNGGIPFIDDVSLIREFGIQGGSVVWDDVTLPTNLFSRGKTWLGSQKIAHVQYQIRAVDLFLIGLDLDSFEVGNSYPVKNPIMEIDERLRIIGKSLDITSPQDASLTIGDKLKTLHQYQRDLKQSAQHMVNLQRTVSKQVGKMNSLSKNFGEASQELQSLKEAVGDANVKEMERFVSNLENQLQEIEGQIQGLPTVETIATMQRDIENHTQSMTDIQVRIEPMEQTIETNKNHLETVKTDVQSLEERVKKLEEGGIRRG
ncbi:lysin, partial [Bacillus thuringiensis]|nr:lysin [Bacillus thuringiensis]